MTVTYLVGDTREQVATLDAGSVSLVATSPPFIALRSYLPADHPMKHAEIGSEPDPATFLDTLLALTAEWGRVLAPWGSIAIELGDTYAGGSAQGTDQSGSERYPNGRGQEGLINGHTKSSGEWPRAKCLALVPQLYAASLAYGRNLLTGEGSPAGQWLVRNLVVWHRPNPAVGALGDKYRPSTSYITIATRSPKRWFDLTAVRTAYADGVPPVRPQNPALAASPTKGNTMIEGKMMHSNPAGAPPLDAWFDQHDTWTLTTQPSSLAHYAMWPPKLAERLILSMCPAEVCTFCGEPRRRLEKVERCVVSPQRASNAARSSDPGFGNQGRSTYETLGWTDCGCGVPFTPGVVLDPFGGSGTTGAVAHLHGRDAVLIDIDERNRDMYPARLEECRRALFGTTPELPGQLDMFEGVA